jgi:hypothetical protein
MVLEKLDFEWQFSKDKKLKCRIKLEGEPLLDDELFIQDFLVRKFLRFNITIFKEPILSTKNQSSSITGHSSCMVVDSSDGSLGMQLTTKGQNYLINLYLVKGTTLVFTDFAHNFFNLLKVMLKTNTWPSPRQSPRHSPR